MSEIRRVAWVVSTLKQVGGGERLLLEVREQLERAGVLTHILTWEFDPVALFDGKYSRERITLLSAGGSLRSSGVASRAVARIRTVPALRRQLRAIDPDIIICQSEYDCALVFLATAFSRYRYALKIFGQMFQFPHDVAKYTLVFRRHLREIRASMPGYVATVPLRAPRIGVVNRVFAELISVVRYCAVRRARALFVLSNQVRWEVQKLYGRDAVVLRAAFSRNLLSCQPSVRLVERLGLVGRRVVLCVGRLVPKKRVDLAIEAFAIALREVPDAHLVIAGTGPEEQQLRELARVRSVAASVTFVGHVPEADLVDYFGGCDVFLNLDVADYDIAAFEALALGKRVVCSCENEFDSLFRRAGCVLAAQPEPMPLATALRQALAAPPVVRTPELAQALLGYTWEAYTEELLRRLRGAA